MSKRWATAATSSSSDVTEIDGVTFRVRSVDSGQVYTVHLGSSSTDMPHCECEDWSRYHWPCKHFCIVFRHTEHDWEELCESYRDSPYFSIDNDVITTLGANSDTVDLDQSSVGDDISFSDATVSSACVDEAPDSLEWYAAECRQRLRHITDMTYLCQQVDSMKQLLTLLHQAEEHMSAAVPSDAGLALNLPTIPTRSSLRRLRKRRKIGNKRQVLLERPQKSNDECLVMEKGDSRTASDDLLQMDADIEQCGEQTERDSFQDIISQASPSQMSASVTESECSHSVSVTETSHLSSSKRSGATGRRKQVKQVKCAGLANIPLRQHKRPARKGHKRVPHHSIDINLDEAQKGDSSVVNTILEHSNTAVHECAAEEGHNGVGSVSHVERCNNNDRETPAAEALTMTADLPGTKSHFRMTLAVQHIPYSKTGQRPS